ncbi:MAG: enoyl-CoA hydratase/isomerase family protein [Candidatus Nanopelagicales bacterium]|jgi:enoyl-CoA hydratase/carnithine racemase|nr:enoyl-CoA hydratase/isomerase family protein [Candidatus Nanopelagicales bacterium]
MAAEVVLAGELTRVELDGAVATLRLDRPPVNALNLAMQREILAAARWIADAPQVRAVVIHGGERMFAAGADIKEMAAMTYQEMEAGSKLLQESFQAVAAIPCPVIAAITGYALGGGCELALAADLRVAGTRAKLGQPEVLLGVIPGLGGSQRLPRLIGPSRAKDLILTGRHVGAEEALAMGLVDRVVDDAEVHATAFALAAQLAAGAPLALAAAKRAINLGLEVDLATGCQIERLEFAGLFATDDRGIGMASFLAEGPGRATFTGR